MNREQISGTVRNFEQVSATLAHELPVLADRLETLISQVSEVVGENRQTLAGSLANIEEVTAGLKTSVANINKISDKLASGEGTLGKLINSDEAHDELISTLKSVEGGVGTLTDTLGRVQKLKLDLGFEGYYLSERRRLAQRLLARPRPRHRRQPALPVRAGQGAGRQPADQDPADHHHPPRRLDRDLDGRDLHQRGHRGGERRSSGSRRRATPACGPA